ncbi:MAG TPA: pilus assembly protein N-terminal domain-containing protein, partial [Candidatus Rifleibacterium sp.]|nr:pilus assembly protein N-terminal domain-containing protein [Candidatus Rifleibacterium sp.]
MKRQFTMKKSTLFMLVLVSAFITAAFQTQISAAEKLMIPVGKSTSVPAHGVKKILAVKEGIVDVLNVSDEDIILSGLGLGETQLILWDMTGRRVYDVETFSENDTILAKFASIMGNKSLDLTIFPDIAYLKGQVSNPEEKARAETVAQSLLGSKPLVSLIEFEASFTSLQQRIEAAIKLPSVKVSVISPEIDPNIEQGNTGVGSQTSKIRVVLQGSVKDQNEYIHLSETVKGFVEDEEKISNLVVIDDPIQVVFQAYILQVSKNNQKDMGIEWGGQGTDGVLSGILNFGETPGANGNAAVPKYMNPFFMKNINRFDLIAAQVKAWETSGKAKVLANPKLIVYGSSVAEKPDIMARKMS